MDRFGPLELRAGIAQAYPDVLTGTVREALVAVAPLDHERRAAMEARMRRRRARHDERARIAFLPGDAPIPRAGITAADARAGRFTGSEIPHDLQRQWIQGTGPATRPRAGVEDGLRNVAYALLSGADGWMFDGEDALGQVDAMSLDNIRNLKLAFARDRSFLEVAEEVAGAMNAWARGFFGRPIVADWRAQLAFTTRIFRPRGLHLEDRHLRWAGGDGFSASVVDTVLYVVHAHEALRRDGASIVLYLPKIQTAEEAAVWRGLLDALERHLALPDGAIKTYVLVEQLEACFQLMEIRAALGPHFVGYNTGRWDYIHSVADAMAGDPAFVDPNIDAIAMTYGYMRAYEDRVRRAVNTPDAAGRCALWQGGMEPNIPVGARAGVEAGMRRAVAGGEREQREGASGKWVAHWKMVHIVRPVWEKAGPANQLGRAFPPLTYTDADADALVRLEEAPRTERGARDLISVGLQYANAFLRGFQAAALKPADFFADEDVLYLMEDMATGEIRLGILWEWLHKGARYTSGEAFDEATFARLLDEEHAKLLRASSRDVHDDSKHTTLPVAREVVSRYVRHPVKAPWTIDLLNLNLGVTDVDVARGRIADHLHAVAAHGARRTANPDFEPAGDREVL